ncbi:MAG: polyphenol oxidase family protein [Myxococcota bacterium]
MSGGAADARGFLAHPLLGDLGVGHGFGTREATPPTDLVGPRQVHGARVARAVATTGAGRAPFRAEPEEADAIVADGAGACVGVVTADCVPVLVAAEDGASVGAIHAGWRGLAAGVVEAGVAALRAIARAPLRAVVGPCIGPCCYEVDAPVLDALARRFGDTAVASASRPSRPGHARVDLGALVRVDLLRAGIATTALGTLSLGGERACTRCAPALFHSYRRDGAAAGRLVHFVRASPGRG